MWETSQRQALARFGRYLSRNRSSFGFKILPFLFWQKVRLNRGIMISNLMWAVPVCDCALVLIFLSKRIQLNWHKAWYYRPASMVTQQPLPPQEALKRLHIVVNRVVCMKYKREGNSNMLKTQNIAHRDWSTCFRSCKTATSRHYPY